MIYQFGCMIAGFISIFELWYLITLSFSPLADNARQANYLLVWSIGDFVYFENGKRSVLVQLTWFLIRHSIFIPLSWFAIVYWVYLRMVGLIEMTNAPERVRVARWKLRQPALTKNEVIRAFAQIRFEDKEDQESFCKNLAEELAA